MWHHAWIRVLVAGVLVAGCGSEPATLSAGSADDLHEQVAAVRKAVGDGDRVGALEALDELQADVRDLEAGGSLTEADADALRRGIGRARRRARAELESPAAVTEPPAEEPTQAPTPEPTQAPTPEPTVDETPTPAATPQAEPPPQEPGNGKGNGKAKGKSKPKKGKG